MDEFSYIEYAAVIHIAPPTSLLKELAYRNEEMPEGMTSAAQMFFQKARCLYRSVADAEQGKREMIEVERTYEMDIYTETKCHDTAQMWAWMESATIALNKDPTPENAVKFARRIYGFVEDRSVKRGVS